MKNQSNNFVIGLCGYATCGKDTFAKIGKEISETKFKADCRILNLAEDLKSISNPFLKKYINVDLFKCSKQEKEMIRPFMVGIGESFRNFNPRFWIDRVDAKIRDFFFNKENPFESKDFSVVFIPDVRFENECHWLKSFDNYCLVGIERDGIVAPNQQELKNIPFIFENYVDLKIKWNNLENPLTNQNLHDIVYETLEKILWKKHINKN